MKYLLTLIQKIQRQSKIQGFTLIEALVSLGLFSIVVVSASGVILSVISSNKKNQAISSVVNNLNYSIESMVRDIKTGYRYQCFDDAITYTLDAYKLLPETCTGHPQPVSEITLISTITGKEQIVRYELIGGGLYGGYIEKTLYTETGGVISVSSYPLTDQKNVTIDNLGFTIRTPESIIPATTTPTGQPSVFLVIKGAAKINQINISDFFIQTYISQRLPNFI